MMLAVHMARFRMPKVHGFGRRPIVVLIRGVAAIADPDDRITFPTRLAFSSCDAYRTSYGDVAEWLKAALC
jgi:hypothetical protein